MSVQTTRCRDFCHSAVKTIAVLPDREWSWLHHVHGGSPVPILTPAEIQKEWGLDSAIAAQEDRLEAFDRVVRRYRPTPEEITRCLAVLGWLTWLERARNGRTERQIITARAYRISFKSIAERFGRSDETIRRWEAAAIRVIVLEFSDELEAMR